MASPGTPHLSKRLVGFVVACALLSLIWFNAGSEGKLRKTYSSLSKQAQQSPTSAASALAGEKQSDVHAKPHNATTSSTNISDAQDVDAQPHNVKVTTSSKNFSDEQPDVDTQPQNVTTPPTDVSDEQPDFDFQPHNITYPPTNLLSQPPFPTLPPPDDEEYMAICMAVKDQAMDLPEFFTHYYFHHGIRRFYIFDDGTDPPLSSASYPIPSSAITWVYFQPHIQSDHLGERNGIQEKYYTGCVKMFGDRHTWMGFLDADEFLEMTGGETLSDFLHEWALNDTVGAVGVNWLVHSSAGLLTRPEEGPRKAFDRCIIDNPHNDNLKVKTFARTALFDKMWNCHCVARFRNGAIQVGEDGDLITKNCDRNPITRERWGLHHFGPKSKEEFLQKQERGKIRGGKSTQHWWKKIENEEQRDCLELTKYVP